MSEINHTPGPWTFKTHAATGDNGILAEGTGVFVEAFAEIRHVGEGAREEALANARLIAAAPDMIEALKMCAEAIGALHKRMSEIPTDITAQEAFNSFYTGNVDEALDAACHAIAKAEGKQ